jgi:predicted permease
MMEGRLPVEFPVLANDLFTSLAVIGRLRPDVSPAQAEAELATVAWRIEEPDTATGRRPRVLLSPHLWCWRPSDRAQAFSILLPLLALAGLVLAIGCANFANFLLARATSRRKEIAVRLALGAPRARVIRQLVGESVLLALAAALPGLGIAWALAGWFWRLIGLPVETSLDGRVIAYALGLTLLVGVASGLAPAWQATRRDLARDLKAETGQTTRRRATLPTLLLVGQVAAALVLLHAAGLFVRTVNRLTAVDFGFAPDNLLLVRPDFSLTEYSPARRREFQREFADRVASLPTVRSVSHTAVLPRPNNNFWGTRQVVPTGDPAARGDTRVQYNQVDPGFFATLGVPLRRGRDFDAHDTPTSAAVAIVNEALAAQVWPGADPLGRRFRFGDVMFSPEYEVIGVAPNLRVFLREDRPPPQVYLALAQTNNPAGTLLVRLAGEMPAFTRLLRELIRELDPNLPPPEIESFSTYLKNRHAGERMYAILATGLGSIALLLAALGLASLLAYHVAQRQREIGLRLALGATPSGVLALVLREGMAIVLTGQVVGGLAIVAGSRLIARQLFGVAPLDPISAGASILVVGTVALLACWLPARRAARVDPLVALRCD